MAASKELITKIVLKAQADSSISKSFAALSKNSDTCINKLSKIGSTATKAFKYVASAAAAGAVACGKAAIDFESAFAGVQKTVEETDTTSYEDLSNGIRQMAKETPAAATEIANVAAAAGQLGIKADDILSFSKTMIDLGESTNLTADEAATSIAKLFNVTGTSMSEVDNFGATLVALGNNAATTESDILAMASRIAGSGKQIGLTEQQTLALATSLSSVGIEAEMGGSAISTTMSQIDKDVAKNSEELAIWAKTAGMSTSEFSKAWKTDAYGALQKVLKGMADTKDEGGNLNLLLEDLGINGIRQGDTLKRLSSATGLMSEMTDLANKSWKENSALTKEANTRYSTMAAKLQIAKNRIVDAAITIGNKLMPVLDNLLEKFDEIDMDAVADKIANGVQWIIDHFDLVKAGLVTLGAAFAAFKIGGFINTIAGATRELKLFAEATGLTAKVAGLFKAGGLSAAFAGLGTKLSGALSGIGTALASIGPVGWTIIAIIAVLGGAFIALWKTSENFRNKMTSIWNGLKAKFATFADGIVERLNLLGFDFKKFGDIFQKIFSGIGKVLGWIGKFLGHIFSSFFVAMFQACSDLLGNILNIITGVVDVIVGIFTGDWARVWDGAKAIVWNAILATMSNLNSLGRFLWNLFGGIIKSIGGWLGQLWSKIVPWAQNLYSNVKNWVVNAFNSVVTFFKQLPGKIWNWLVNTVTKIGAWGVSMDAKMRSIAMNAVTAVVNFFKTLPGKIWTWLVNTVTKIGAWGSSLWAKAKEIGSNFINAIVTFFQQLPYKIGYCIGFVIGKIILFGQKLWSFATVTVPQFISKVVTWFMQLPGKIWTWLVSASQKIAAWGSSLWAKAKEIGANFVNPIISFFQQLPYKIGYCIGFVIGKIILFGQKLWSFATVTVPQFISKVVAWFMQLPGKIWTWLVNTVTKIVAWGVSLNEKMRSIALKAITAVVNFFKTMPGKIWTWLVNTVTKIAAWGVSMYTKMRSIAIKVVTAVVNYFKQLPGKIWTWLVNTVQKVTAWGANMLAKAKQICSKVITAVVTFFKQLPGKIWTWLVNTVQKVAAWGSQMVAKAKKAAVDTYNAIVNKIKEIPGKMLEIGKNIVKGLWNGLKNAKSWLIDRVKSFGSGIVDGIKGALGINSPSVVMMKLAKFVPQGFGIGITKNAKYAVNAVKAMGGKVTAAASKIRPSISAGLQKFGTGGTVTSPQAAIVGDAPETIVPHGNTPRNRALLAEAARGVGATSGGNVFNFNFAPVINGGNAEENRAMIHDEEEAFERRMQAWLEKNRRLAFDV